MKPAMKNIFGISKQRGIWLRCFLGKMKQIPPTQSVSLNAEF